MVDIVDNSNFYTMCACVTGRGIADAAAADAAAAAAAALVIFVVTTGSDRVLVSVVVLDFFIKPFKWGNIDLFLLLSRR